MNPTSKSIRCASLLLISILAIGSMFTGCNANHLPLETHSQAAEEARPGEAKAAIELKTASWEQAQEIVAKHKGKVVVLDLWSSSCPPCVQEFPCLVKLQQELPADVVCISFNCDFIGLGKPEDDSAAIVEFLREQKAGIINLLSSDADEAVFKQAKIVSLPVVFVYGKDGKVAKQFDNEFTYEKQVSPFVRELVNK